MAENYPVGNINLNNVEEFVIDNEEVVIEPTSDFIVDAPEIKKDYPTGVITNYLKNSAPPPIDYGGVIDTSNIPVGNIDFSNIVPINAPSLTTIGSKNNVINLPEYINNKARSRAFSGRGTAETVNIKGSDIEVGDPIVDRPLIQEDYYQGTLTKEDLLNDEVFVETIRSGLQARFSPTLVSKLAGYTTALAGAPMGGNSRDYANMGKEELYENYKNWMRLFNSLNSVTVANELVAGLYADEKEKGQMGGAYHLWSKMDNAITGRGSWGEMGDALWDYGRSAVHDPLNIVTLGVGKVLFGAGQKAAAAGVTKLMQGYYKTMLTKGVPVKVARQNVLKSVGRRESILAAGTYSLPDLVMNIALDIGEQSQLINVGNQKEIDKSRVMLSALATMVIPAYIATNQSLKELRRSDGLKDSWLGYVDIDNKIKVSGKKAKQLIDDKVKPFIPQMIKYVDENFGNIVGDPSKLKSWEEAKEKAIVLLKNEKSYDPFELDLINTKRFFKEFFTDTVDEKGKVITKGYVSVLQEAGFLFHKEMLQDKKVSGILAETIEYLPEEVLERIVKKFEDKTGRPLRLTQKDTKGTLAKRMGARFISTASEAGAIQNISSQAFFKLNTQIGDPEDALKVLLNDGGLDTSPARMQWALSIYKRLLTSHPVTTGSNIKGFKALTLLDTASEINTSVLNMSQSLFYKTFDPNKIIDGVKAPEYYHNQMYGNFLGAIRRGVSVFTPDLEIKFAREVLEEFPEFKKQLFRDISGDGGAFDSKTLYNMDDKSKLFPGEDTFINIVDGGTKFMQTVALVRLQDELTKLWAFGNNVNSNIMKTYGVSPSVFFGREDIAVEMMTPKFMQLLERGVHKTKMQTASVNWSTLKAKHGKTIMLQLATGLEYATNKTIVGFQIPFGSFMNTVLATFADTSGIQAIRYMSHKAIGKKLDPITQEATAVIGKTMAAWGTVGLFTVVGTNSAINKVTEGRAYNENIRPDGSLDDSQFDWNINQYQLVSQMIAHGLSGDGRNLKQDLSKLNTVADYEEYFAQNFNPKNIPFELVEELGLQLGGSSIRQVDRLYKAIGNTMKDIADGRVDSGTEFLLDRLPILFARVAQGASRGLEPYSTVANVLNGNHTNFDLKQGAINYNTATKYIEGLIPEDRLNIFDTEIPYSEMYEKPEVKGSITSGTEYRPDLAKFLGSRNSQKLTYGKVLLNQIGLKTWDFINWQGDARIKNAMNTIAAPIFEELAIETLKKYPTFGKLDLDQKKQIIIGKGGLKEELKKRTLEILNAQTPPSLSLLRDVTKGSKVKRDFALKFLGLEDDMDAILKREDAVQVLQNILYYMKEYETISLGLQNIATQ